MTGTAFRSVLGRYLPAGPATGFAPPPSPASPLDIAVVGMAGRVPGADDFRAFWDNLAAGRTCVGELPAEVMGENTRGYRWGGVIADRDSFDPEFFGIDPLEADSMNLNQRLLLQEAWHALEDAGIDPFRLRGSDTGIFVGAEPAGYLHVSFTGASDALVATRLSYILDWHGPALVVDTACSSSIVAIHLACQSLLQRECDLVLAAGANVGLGPGSLNLLADMGVLSPSGQCRTFDSAADGTVFAEGIAVLVLKRLADAEAAGDDIRGVIRATGVNHDGASNGLTAPNGLAQEKLIGTVYRRFGIDASRIGYVEAHGTGTTLGDPVEANAVVRAFGKYRPNPDQCVLGSAKAYIGHAGAASGAIGLVKVLLSMRNEWFPGLPTFRTLNPMIKLDGSGITIDAVGRLWHATPGVPRLAAVNSMGHSGTNAHLVVEEYLPTSRAAVEVAGPVAVPLSARNRERLGVLAGGLADYLDRVCSASAGGAGTAVRRLIAELLGIAPADLHGDRDLESHGAEPHQLARLAILLTEQTGRRVTVDTLYDAPSVDDLVASLAADDASTDGRLSQREPPHLADVARTLQRGRAALAERAVAVVGSMPQLVAALRALAAGSPTPDTVTGQARAGEPPTADGRLVEMARAWCRGAEVDWPDSGGRRVALPGYPFARHRHGKGRLTAGSLTPQALVQTRTEPEPAYVDTPTDTGSGGLCADVTAWLAGVVAAEAGIDPGQTDAWRSWDALGIDSVARTRVNHRIAQAFPDASRTLLFEFGTAAEVAQSLAMDFPEESRALPGTHITGPAGTTVTVAEPAGTTEPGASAGSVPGDPVAIIGLSLRFPAAPDADRYWDLIVSNRCAIGEIPPRRWDWREYFVPEPKGREVVTKTHSRWGAFLEDFDQFDAEFFGMTEREVRNTDPQQRIFLQECWKALEDAGYSPHSLDPAVRQATGVFAGASKLGFDRLGADRGVDLPRTSFGDMVNRVSYHLDLGGPSHSVDTACSSALVALHEAVESLCSGECVMALVGGVNLYLHPSTYAELSAAKMLSNRPECPAFGIGGNGIVPGEGVGVVVLKRLADARRDNDHVRAVIRGTAVNHNGRTVGFSSPNPRRQADVIRAALRRAGVEAETVSYLETTVNGTEIGDAVEMTAVSQVFGARAEAAGRFRLGSVKPNIGHGEASSGMAQLAKVILALGARTLPPTRLPDTFNPAIDRGKLPFELSDTPAPWDRPVVRGRRYPRRAGITGIGAGGANAHVVVEEAPAVEVRSCPGPAVFVLSARTPEQLASTADNWSNHLHAHPDLDLARVAYSSQVGREPMRFRLALVAESVAEIVDRLRRWRAGDTSAVETGEARQPASAVRAERAQGRTLTELARIWANGGMIAWASLYQQCAPMRLGGLPTYPFATTGYWGDPPVTAVAPGRSTTPGIPMAASAPPVARPPTVAGHPLLDLAGATTGADGTLTVTGSVSLAAQPWLADHVVNGRVLLVGTALVDMVARVGAVAGAGRIDELTLHSPLDLTQSGQVALRIVLAPTAADGCRVVEVTSRPAGAAENRPWSRHATGVCSPLRGALDFDLTEWPPPGARRLPADDYYAAMDAAGYTYGPVFQSLRAVWVRGHEVFAEVELPAASMADASRYGVHPALLDCALHAMGFGTWVEGGGGRLPFAWTGISVHPTGAGGRARARLTAAGSGGVALQLADADGRPVAQIDSLVLRPATGERPDLVRDALFTVEWVPLSKPAVPPAGTWSLLGPDVFGIGTVVTPAERGTFAVLSLRGPVDVAVTAAELVPAAHEATGALLDIVRDWLVDPANRGRRLVVLTQSAIAVEPGEGLPDLVTAPAWGLLRAAQSEYQGRLVLVDMDRHTPIAAVPAAITSAVACDELHLAIRGDRVLVPKLVPAAQDPGLAVPDTPTWRLDTTAPGTLDSLALVPAPDATRPLVAEQVRIAVRAAALNFRDVLGALGLYPGDLLLGVEGAGVVTEIGPDVTRLAVGDRVFGLMPGGIGPVCVTDARTVRRIPPGWSYAEAASASVAYLTAYYALIELAGLRAGESVLVHAAAGGVGSAAVRLARHVGAEVFATASPAKHAEVRAMGVPAALIRSSRDTDYAAAFAAGTGNRGVDVVLNSLAVEHVDASLRLLSQGGRFIEMGKTGIRRPEDVARTHPGVRYQAFDLVEAGPERIGAMLDTLMPLFEGGELPPPTRTVLDVRRAGDAMRTMREGRHVGRIVLAMPRSLAPGGTVFVAGGTGTLGSVVARDLVTAHGVRHLVLASRRGDAAPGAGPLVAELTALGADVRVVRCDVTDRCQVAAVLAGIPAEHPLTGVVQVVGALDDGLLRGQTRARLAPVLRAKLDAAVILDELTRAADPDVFVLFSGAAGVLGNPGQSTYGAANAFLDALARRRRTDGLPGLSIAFGLWASVSDLTRDLDEEAVSRMARGGFRMLSDADGMALFSAALTGPAEFVVAMRLDRAALRAAPVHPILRALAGQNSATAPATRTTSVAAVPASTASVPVATMTDRLAAAEPNRRRDVVRAVIGEQIAAILPGCDATHIAPDIGFTDLGFDSLTAVELRNRLDRVTGLRLPVTLVFDQPTVGTLAGYLLGLLADRIPAAPATPAAPAVGEPVRDPWAALFAAENLAVTGAIADLGGSGGRQLAALAARAGRAVVHAVPVDPDAAMPATYDMVVALGCLITVRRRRHVFARIDAALIDGGRILLADYLGTLRGDLDDRAAGVLVPSMDSWVALLGSGRLVVDEVTEPPRVLDPRLDHAELAEPRRRGWIRPVLLRLRKDTALAAGDRDPANRRALTQWVGA